VADQRLGVHAAQFLLADRERHDRHVLRLQALVAQFLVEGHVRVAVDRRDHAGLAAGRELLDVADDGLVVGVAERGVDLVDVLSFTPLLFRKARRILLVVRGYT
jgi:hypothetical protein